MLKKKKTKIETIIGIDPGSREAGYCIYYPQYNTIGLHGHDEWETVRMFLKKQKRGHTAVVVEEVIFYSNTPGNRKILPPMLEEVGRIKQICEDCGYEFHQVPRIDVCTYLAGKRPTKNNPVSKADIQEAVKKLLGKKNVVRPQHANDALAAALTVFKPRKKNGKKRSARTKKKAARKRKV